MNRDKEIKAMFRQIGSKPICRETIFARFRFSTDMFHPDRYLRQLVQDMKLAGYPIISTSKGYCKATKGNEVLFSESQAQILSRIRELKKVHTAQGKMYAGVKGQKKF